MSLLFHKRTLDEVLGNNTRMTPPPQYLGTAAEPPVLGGAAARALTMDQLLDKDQTGCRCEHCLTGSPHWVLHADDGVTFDHSCAKMSGGRVGMPDHFGNGQVQCPICNQSA